MASTFFGLNNTTLNFNTSSTSLFFTKPKDEDCIFLDNSKLVIDSDNRWGYNGFLFSLIGNVNYGDLLIDGRNVWEIPFSSSSGYVPMLSAIEYSNMTPASGITSGAYGELLNVWNNTSFSPLTASSNSSTSLPLSGWIKLRSKTGNFIAGETIKLSNGSTIVASTSGKRSWINIAATNLFVHPYYGDRGGYVDFTSIFSTLSVVGDWYYLNETTNGQYNQQIKVPVQDILYGAWIEDAPNSNNYIQYHNACTMWGLTAANVNNFVIGSLSSNGFFYSQNHENLTISLAYSGTNGRYGYLPPAGCKIRIPNVTLSVVKRESNFTHLNNSISELYGGYNYGHSSSLAYNTYINYCNSNWRVFDANYGGLTIQNSCFCTGQKYGATVKLLNCICGPSYQGDQGSIISQYGGGYVSAFLNYGSLSIEDSSIVCARSEDLYNTTVTGNGSSALVGRLASKNYVKNTRLCSALAGRQIIDFADMSSRTTNYFENVTIIGIVIHFSNVENITFKNLKVATRLNGSIDFGYEDNLFGFYNCKNIYVDGVYAISELENVILGKTDGISKCFPYRINESANIQNLTIKNVGTSTHPLTCCHQDAITRRYWGVFKDGSSSIIKLQNIHVVARKFFTLDDDSQGYNFGTGVSDCLFENLYVYDSPIKIINNPAVKDQILQYDSVARSLYIEQPVGWVGNTRPSAVGTHWVNSFNSPVSGILSFYTTQTTEKTKPFVTENFQQTPYKSGYNPNGQPGGNTLTLSNSGDYLISETPYYILGITGFQNVPAIALCSNIFDISFQYDIWGNNTYNGTWLSLNFLSSIYYTYATNVQNLTGIQIDPNIGIKLKIKISAPSTLQGRYFNNLAIYTKTDPASQQILYPPEKDTKGIIKNLIQGTRVQIYNTTTNQELFNGIHTAVGDFVYDYTNGVEISTNDIIRIRLVYVNGTIAKQRQQLNAIATLLGFTLHVIQTDDTTYNSFGIDGATITEFSADYPNVQVDISDPDQTTSIKRLYAWWISNEFTINGIRNFFGGIEAEDAVNFKINPSIIDLKLDNTRNVGVIFEGDYRLYRTDGQIPIVTTTSGGGSIVLYAGRVSTNTISVPAPALTLQESATLNKINTLPQDTFNLNLSAIENNNNSIGARLKNSATVSNVAQIVADGLSL